MTKNPEFKKVMYADVLFPLNAEAFTYLVPEELRKTISVGLRVLAPFRRKNKVGIIARLGEDLLSDKSITLKSVSEILDEEPLVSEEILKLIKWTGQYYMSTTGLALKNAVPSAIFTGQKAGKARITYDAEPVKGKKVRLTSEQNKALEEINRIDSGVFLLHGVTGSGKTEVYINAIRSLPEGKKAIVLVPEIAITVQMIERFRGVFGQRVIFYHSGLSAGEKITNWQKMKKGDLKVVIGVRSAVFAPLDDLGLMVVDEEQESSYKQFEGLRYNARDVAIVRAKMNGIKVVLGSATPSLEAFYNAENGSFRYLELTHRIDRKPLPLVEIIDMTKEKKRTFSLSTKLLNGIEHNISKGHQSLIMLNRRGYSPFFMCSDCGYIYKCPACSITLIYHKDTNSLKCHYCNSYLKPGENCPKCKGTGIKYLGAGTQRVEDEICSLVPGISLKRMDRDTTRKKLSHHRIIKKMDAKEISVLLGTQMVAKGHDFPDVTLSAVVSADIALNLPDFRSAEKAFQLFTQLAGRAGRGTLGGKSCIQTYEPEHYVFDYVRDHNYKGFYRKEIEFRKELSYPPFSRIIRVILSFRTKDSAEKVIKKISGEIKKTGQKGLEVLGPSPAPIEKIRNLWRWHIIFKGKNAMTMRTQVLTVINKIKNIKTVKIDIDVDPVNLM